MHFPIIEIKDKPVKKDERMSYCALCDDSCINYNTDYVGDEYDDDQRARLFDAEYLPKFFDGIATVDASNESITFLDDDTIRNTFDVEIRKAIDSLYKNKSKYGGCVKPDDLAYIGNYWRGFDMLFFCDGAADTSGGFISYARYYAGKTLYIGNVFDAHC